MKPTLPLNIVIVYENFTAAVRAQNVSQRLAAELDEDFEISREVWGFELLGHPQLRQEAAAAAVEADLVVVSVSGAAELPAHVRTWVESWVTEKRGGLAALVALVDWRRATRTGALPLCTYLRQIADKAGMDFFCNAEGGRPESLGLTDRSPRREMRPAAFEDIAPDHAVWHASGIND